MNRKQALRKIRFCGFHDNRAAATLVYIENKISYTAFQDEYRIGVGMRLAGVKCDCPECQKQEGSKTQ